MDYLRKNKMIGWLVLILVLLNTATLTKLWLDKGPKGPRGNRGGSEDLLTKELSLNEAQVEQIESLRKSHFRAMQKIRDDQQKARRALHELWQDENMKSKANELSANIGSLQELMELETFNHFSSIRQLLSKEQKLKFDKIIHDVMRRGDRNMEGPPPNGPRRPGPPDNRPPPKRG